MALATVNVDIAPVYEKPSVDSTRTDELLYGMSVQVIQQSESGWCYVRTEYSLEGYMPTACLQTDANVAAAWRKYKKVTVLAPYIDAQKAPETTAPKAVGVPRGGILVALGSPGEDGWQKIGLCDGKTGYTRISYLGQVITDWQAVSEEDMRWNIVETALSYNGTALRCGGRTPQGMDGMGLVAMSYMINGVYLPRTRAEAPAAPLHTIDSKKMEEGDILYFANSVGIYMGEGRFVHVSEDAGSEGVMVSSLRPKEEGYLPELADSLVRVDSLY